MQTRASWPLIALLLAVLAAGCTAGRDSGRASDATAEHTPTAVATQVAPDGSPSQARGPRSRCLRHRERIVEALWYPTFTVLDSFEAMYDHAGQRSKSPGPHQGLSMLLRRVLTLQARAEVLCGHVPAALSQLGETARTVGAAVDEHASTAIRAAYVQLAAALGQPRQGTNLVRDLQVCRRRERQVQITYRAWWKSMPEARRWWIELTFRNRTNQRFGAALYGDVWSDQMLPSEGATAGDGHRHVVGWGGSSADYWGITPGVARQIVAPGADQWVDTSSLGSLHVLHAEVGTDARVGGRTVYCWLPVTRDPASADLD